MSKEMTFADYQYYIHLFSACEIPNCEIHQHLDWEELKSNCQSVSLADAEECDINA